MDRPHPFDLIFGAFRDTHLPAIANDLSKDATLDQFVLASTALQLMRELRPDRELGPAVDDFAALVYLACRYWRDGERTVSFDSAQTRALMTPSDAAATPAPGTVEVARYIQIAPRRVWAQLDVDAAFEPLDGWFCTGSARGLLMVACFGVLAPRPGVSVAQAEGPNPIGWSRSDGSPLFSPTMPGGAVADLRAVQSPQEMLLLGWRALSDEDSMAAFSRNGE